MDTNSLPEEAVQDLSGETVWKPVMETSPRGEVRELTNTLRYDLANLERGISQMLYQLDTNERAQSSMPLCKHHLFDWRSRRSFYCLQDSRGQCNALSQRSSSNTTVAYLCWPLLRSYHAAICGVSTSSCTIQDRAG